MTPEREERLLELAGEIKQRLETVSVPALGKGHRQTRADAIGIPAACVGMAASFLAAERDVKRFREFLGLFDGLDELTAQNQTHPKADYRVLGEELEASLDEHPKLDADEWFYVLSWVRRLLPAKAKVGRAQPRPSKPRRPPEPVEGKFSQMAEALRKKFDPSS